MEVKNKYAYVITQDICNKFIEENILWDIWFSYDAVCCNIEYLLIIDEIINRPRGTQYIYSIQYWFTSAHGELSWERVGVIAQAT